MTDLLILILVIIGILMTIALSAFFSGSEMALSSCNLVRLENEAEDGDKRAGLAWKLSNNFDDTLSSILVGNNLVNTASSSLSTMLVILLTGSDKLTFVATIVITVLVILFGETMPKIAAKKAPTRMAKKVAPFINFFRILFWPIDFVVVLIVRLITLPIKEKKEDEEEAAEELQSLIDTAEDEGVLDSERSEMLSAAIDFSEISASEVMTARVDMDAFDVDDSQEDIIKMALECTHTRVPVYEESIDHIIGVVHLNPFLKALAENPETDIRDVMMEPLYVYKTTKLPKVLNQLKKNHQHLAIVTDEYSGTAGIITLEDVLEEIVGDIWDETDEVEEEVVELQSGQVEIDGDMHIDDFLEIIGMSREEFEYESETAGGFVTEYRGDFPSVGDTFTFHGYSISVLEMEERRVLRMVLEKLDF